MRTIEEIRRDHTWYPYCIDVDHASKRFYFLNRFYKLIGSDDSVGYQTYPDIKAERVYFYSSDTYPWSTWQLWRQYVLTVQAFIARISDYENVGAPLRLLL